TLLVICAFWALAVPEEPNAERSSSEVRSSEMNALARPPLVRDMRPKLVRRNVGALADALVIPPDAKLRSPTRKVKAEAPDAKLRPARALPKTFMSVMLEVAN